MARPRWNLLPLLLLLAACDRAPPPFPGGTVIDLTHAFDAETIYWPTDTRGFQLETVFSGETDKGYYYSANRFAAAEHGGTHVDAPVHFAAGRRTLDRIPVEQLIGPGVLIDASAACEADPDHLVGVAELESFERAHGRIPDGAIVLLFTGYGARWPDRARYLGTDLRGDEAVTKLHFPGLDPDAARWLVERRTIGAVGLDTPSIDRGPSSLFESHRILFAKDVPAFENVANLDRLPATGFQVIALPMKIKDGTGGPLRIVAVVP